MLQAVLLQLTSRTAGSMVSRIVIVCFMFAVIGLGLAAQLTARLANGNAPWNGRLEILYQGQWGTVCDDNFGFGKEEAQVACKMLGYNSSRIEIVTPSYIYGEGSGPILLDNVTCLGSETSLDQCQHGGFYKHDCNHTEDVGINCNHRKHSTERSGLNTCNDQKGRYECSCQTALHWKIRHLKACGECVLRT